MKLKALLGTLSELLDSDSRQQSRDYDELKKVLKKLKKKRDRLRDELSSAKKDERERIEQQLTILEAQRKKGINVLKELKANQKKSKKGK